MTTSNVAVYFSSIMASTGALMAVIAGALAVRLTINLFFDFFLQVRTAFYDVYLLKKSNRKEEI